MKKEVETQRVFCIYGLLTDVGHLDKPNLMKHYKDKAKDGIERSMNAQDLGKKDPTFGDSILMSNNDDYDDSYTPVKKENREIKMNEIDSEASMTETESYAHTSLSNFYFFAN